MKLLNDINYFYYKMSLHELQVMNDKDMNQNLSYNSILYLNVILQNDKCTTSLLAKQLQVTKSAVTLKINELERQGAIIKRQSDIDKRVFYISLSDEMKKSFQLYDDIFKVINDRLIEKYDDEQLVMFASILNDISSFEWRKIKDESKIKSRDND